MAELLPCPFCGNEPIIMTENEYATTYYQIRCGNYDCWIGPQTSFYSEKETAIEAWNTRTKERGAE